MRTHLACHSWHLSAACGFALDSQRRSLDQLKLPNNGPAQNGPELPKRGASRPGGPAAERVHVRRPECEWGANGNAARRGANADFDSLIDLIESTVATETWAENGGGEAEIRPFPGGVLVDAAGMLRLKSQADDSKRRCGQARATRGARLLKQPRQASKASALRYVSLPRLEREIARRQAAHEPLDPAMLTLAGLQRVRYVFVYPESGDLVLAGPAGDWLVDDDGRIVATDTLEPVVRLDDLLVLMRRGAEAADSHFGCSINPRQEALAKTQAFLASSSQKPLEPGQRKKWLSDLRDTVGRQDIEIFGIDPASRVAERAGRGRLSHEAHRHGLGRRRGRRGELFEIDSLAAGRVAAGDVGAAVVVHAQLRRDRAVGSERCVRARGPGRARAERKRDAGRAGPTRSHRPERSAQSAVCRVVHGAFRRAGEEVSGLRRAAKYLRSGDGRGGDSKRRAGRESRLEADAAGQRRRSCGCRRATCRAKWKR